MRNVSNPERPVQEDIVTPGDGLPKRGIGLPSIKGEKYRFGRTVQHACGFPRQALRTQCARAARFHQILRIFVPNLRRIDLALESDDAVQLLLAEVRFAFL